MKLIHTADWQYGYRQYGFREREEDFYRAGRHIAMRAIALKVDAVIIAGDLFDAIKPPGNAVREVCDIVRQLNAENIAVLGVAGNHDAVGNEWMHVCGIRPIPPEQFVFTGQSGESINMAGVNGCRPTMFHKAVDSLVNAGRPVDIFVLHQSIAELADFPNEDITALELSGKLVKIGVRYVAMGDIHAYKEMVIGGVRFNYPGSIESNAMDEERNKCFSIIDITDSDLKTSYEPIPTRPIIEIDLKTEAELDTLLKELDTDVKPLAQIWYDPENRELAKRAEEVLRSKDIMHRVCPIGLAKKDGIAVQMNKEGFERAGALDKLKAAVEAFFDANSEQYQLVLQLLEHPDSVKEIMEQYMKSKGAM